MRTKNRRQPWVLTLTHAARPQLDRGPLRFVKLERAQRFAQLHQLGCPDPDCKARTVFDHGGSP